MCFGGGGGDGGAAEQRRQEEMRQQRVREGRDKIDETFAQFDQPFFDARRQSYIDYASPQLEDQFKDASRDLLLALTRSGLQNSSARARRFADLQKQYDTNARGIANKALDFENRARSSVESAKSDLYSQNQNLADPAMVAQNAMNRATTLTQMPSYNPLLALFEGVTAGIATQADLERRGLARKDTGLFSTSNASKVVD